MLLKTSFICYPDIEDESMLSSVLSQLSFPSAAIPSSTRVPSKFKQEVQTLVYNHDK